MIYILSSLFPTVKIKWLQCLLWLQDAIRSNLDVVMSVLDSFSVIVRSNVSLMLTLVTYSTSLLLGGGFVVLNTLINLVRPTLSITLSNKLFFSNCLWFSVEFELFDTLCPKIISVFWISLNQIRISCHSRFEKFKIDFEKIVKQISIYHQLRYPCWLFLFPW